MMFLKTVSLFLLFICSSTAALAAMTISGTRVIFPGSEKEMTVRTNNKSDLPVLAQVWVDDGKSDASADVNTMQIPFIVTPPIFRVEPKRGQGVRLIYNGMSLPQDRESVFWFNLLEIPRQNNDANQNANLLQLAFRTRIKIFYRPSSLKSESANNQELLKWEVVDNNVQGRGIKVTNPTPYYFSFDSVTIKVNGKDVRLKSDMVAPGDNMEFYPEQKIATGTTISEINYKLLNDYGAVLARKLNSSGQGFVLQPNN